VALAAVGRARHIRAMQIVRVVTACAALGVGVLAWRAPVAEDWDWLSYGRDLGNQRYSPLDEINASNVSRLALAWRHDTRPAPLPRYEGLFKQESSPIVVDGVLYYTYPGPQVFAVDGATGRELWRFATANNGPIKLCCGPNNRGVGYANGRVFVATLDARVIALDAKTGAQAWESRAASGADGYSFTMAPLVADGKVIVGVAGGEFEIRGFVDAYDAKTGARLWRFYTIPSP
jgi:glucose dehydrogenase